MSRSAKSTATGKFSLFIALLSVLTIFISGCGEDSFTTGDGSTQPNGSNPNSPGTGTPTTPSTDVYVGIAGAGSSFLKGVLDVGIAGPLSARGSTTITGFLIDGNDNAYTSPVTFDFTSTCVANGTASIDSPVTSVNGVIRSTYHAEGCAGSDVILATATVNGNDLSASGLITIQPASVSAIEFVSANPQTISLQGTAGVGLKESSTVTFRVVDEAGRPIGGADVSFSLSTTVGGITLDSSTGSTRADGTVQVSVKSGTVNTSVRVVATATTATGTVSTQSVALAISTGIPDQNSFQIAATSLRPSAWDCNGEQVTITAFAADHFNNPAPDGTAVAFQTESGFIEGSCTTVAGRCSVQWTSNAPRPVDDFGVPAEKLAGRVTILATAIGEESYADSAPSNGRFDDGESFADLPEAFLDINENGSWDAGLNEEYIDFNGNGIYDLADGTYNGALCGPGATSCNTASPLITVSDSIVLVMASRTQNLTVFQDADVTPTTRIALPDNGTPVTIRVQYEDDRGQQPPAGSSIKVTTSTGELLGATATDIPDNNSAGPSTFTVALRAGTTPEPGILTVTLDMPANACDAGLSVSNGIPVDIVVTP